MNPKPLQLAIVYPGDAEARRQATPKNNRFAALFDAFAAQGVNADPVVYNDAQVDAVRAQLLTMDGALVWVNPIQDGRPRDTLDDMLREVASRGVMVSTHPQTILKLGTKDVLVDTRQMGWGSDCHRIDTAAQLRQALPKRLAGRAARVLKQWRGHSGIGVWQVRGPADGTAPDAQTLVDVRHAERGSVPEQITFEAFASRMEAYFEDGGHMVDQAWQPRLAEGMVRCYLVQDRVVGFGLQAVNALFPAPEGENGANAPPPGPRLYHPPDLPAGQALKQRLENEWVPELQRTLGLSPDDLPMLWDCDFLLGERGAAQAERYVLCEINVSSVAPFPDSTIAPLVAATIRKLRN